MVTRAVHCPFCGAPNDLGAAGGRCPHVLVAVPPDEAWVRAVAELAEMDTHGWSNDHWSLLRGFLADRVTVRDGGVFMSGGEDELAAAIAEWMRSAQMM